MNAHAKFEAIAAAAEEATAVGLKRLVDHILESAKMSKVRRYGPHVVTTYKDGRKQALTAQRYPGEPSCGPTPYELLQLGEKCPCLHPVPPNLWALGAVAASLIGVWGTYALGRASKLGGIP